MIPHCLLFFTVLFCVFFFILCMCVLLLFVLILFTCILLFFFACLHHFLNSSTASRLVQPSIHSHTQTRTGGNNRKRQSKTRDLFTAMVTGTDSSPTRPTEVKLQVERDDARAVWLTVSVKSTRGEGFIHLSGFCSWGSQPWRDHLPRALPLTGLPSNFHGRSSHSLQRGTHLA